MNKKLAKIKSAKLGMQDRGILTFWVIVDYEDGCSQGVGGMTLDTYCKDKKRRVGTVYGSEMIRQILIEMEVDDLSELVGRHIWVYGEGEGLSFKPTGIKALATDNKKSEAVIFSDVFNEFGGSE